MAVDDPEMYARGRAEALSLAVKSAPGEHRLVIEASSLLRRPAAVDFNAWSDLLVAAESFVAASTIRNDFPGPAIVLYLSGVNRFIGNQGDVEGRLAVKRATKLLRSRGCLEDPDVRRMRELAFERTSFARTSSFLRSQLEEALASSGKAPAEARDLAKRVVEAGNKSRHEAEVSGSYESARVVTGTELRALSPEEMKHWEQDPKLVVPRRPLLAARGVVLHEFSALVEPARIGCAYTIANNLRVALQTGGGS
ncbi:MAG: hypothetical protein R3F62_16945 [Planctomycetota bacterium]